MKSEINQVFERLRQEKYTDDRETIFEISVELLPGERLRLAGQTLESEQLQVALDSLPQELREIALVEVRVLLDDATPWALVQRGVTDLRREPSNRAERVSQALLGEAVRVLEQRQDWARVRMEKDGYLGWIQIAALHPCDQAHAAAYLADCQAFVCADLLPAYLARPRQQNGILPFGVSLPVEHWDDGWTSVRLPDGELLETPSSGLLPLSHRPTPAPAGVAFTLDLLRRFVGVPYLWGGRTPFGYDCSGLAQAFLGFLGIQARRDADQQYHVAKPVEGTPRPGDLLFFGGSGPATPNSRYANITHVAISLGGDDIIHANGAAWSVSYNSLNPNSSRYRAWLRENLVGVGRFWE